MTTPIPVVLEQPAIPFRNAAVDSAQTVTWDSYVGQEPMKRQLQVYIRAALNTNRPLPHVLLSGPPGYGKTTLARCLADEMQSNLYMLVPPFTPETLYQAVLLCGDADILFIDEIHKMADHGPAMAERLLHMMVERKLYLEGGVYDLMDFTLVGATTNAGKLPKSVFDRFPIRPYFQRYSLAELVKITKVNFCDSLRVTLRPDTMVAIAKACRGTPRFAGDLVLAAQALQDSLRRACMPQELLDFMELEPDGTGREHVGYACVLYQFHGRDTDEGTVYLASESTMMTALDQDRPGLARLERFLVERGLLGRTPQGRRLTDLGVAKARDYVARGLGINAE